MNKNERIEVSIHSSVYRNKERNFVSFSVHAITEITKNKKHKIASDTYTKTIRCKTEDNQTIEIVFFSKDKKVLKI